MKLKRKNLKALRLTKETVRELETPMLSFAQGGRTNLSQCNTGCTTIVVGNCCAQT